MAIKTQPISTRRKTMLAILDGYNHWDLDKILALRTEDCTHEFAPKSLPLITQASLSNAAYRAYLSSVMPFFRNFTIHADEVFEDDDANKMAVWAHSTAETDAGPYRNEYALFFWFSEDGTRVRRFTEMVDSRLTMEFFPKFLEKKGEGEDGR